MSKRPIQTKPVFLRASPEWLAKIEAWRRTQSPIPSQSDAIRRLVEAAVEQDLTPHAPTRRASRSSERAAA